MAYVPSTDDDRKKMLEKIGVKSFDELLTNIPDDLKLKDKLDLFPKLSEYEAVKTFHDYADENKTADSHVCFMGGGAYDHYVPAIVGSVLQRPEFKTAYTPYQAEVSQGTLQSMYEFQTMICQLTEMEVSNASIYDGASSLAEAVLMCNAHNKRSEFLIAGTLNPNYRRVIDTITSGKNFEYKEFVKEDGTADIDGLKEAMHDKVSGVIVQHPNFYGNLEEVKKIEEIAHSVKKAMFIVVAPIMSLGVLEAPGRYDADVVVSEGQPLGIPLSFGGPYLGIFACKKSYIRKIPGRISGETVDENGVRSYVLTLQTREQQIKREKATSNICTNQGLFMLASTVYMEAMGKQGYKEISEQCFHRAHYLAREIEKLNGFKLSSEKPFYNEFLVDTPVPPKEIVHYAQENDVLAGIDTSRFKGHKEGLLIAVTEKRTKEEMDQLIELFKNFEK